MADQNRSAAIALIDFVSLLVSKVVPWLLAIWLVVEVRNTAISLSGKDTLIGAFVELSSNVRVTRGFAFIFGAFGLFYGFKQRTLRRASEQHLRKRVADLESRKEELR